MKRFQNSLQFANQLDPTKITTISSPKVPQNQVKSNAYQLYNFKDTKSLNATRLSENLNKFNQKDNPRSVRLNNLLYNHGKLQEVLTPAYNMRLNESKFDSSHLKS